MRSEYRFDFITNTIIFNKGFYERACLPDTEEHLEMLDIIEKYPHMKRDTRRTPACKKSVERKRKNLTYRYMRAFIRNLDPENLLTFEDTIKYYKDITGNDTSAYAKVADWFVANYPEHEDMVVGGAPQMKDRCVTPISSQREAM